MAVTQNYERSLSCYRFLIRWSIIVGAVISEGILIFLTYNNNIVYALLATNKKVYNDQSVSF